VSKGVWAEQLEQDSWDIAALAGQLGRDGRDRTARQDSWYRTAWAGQRDKTTGAGQAGQEAGTGGLGQVSRKDRRDSIARIKDRTAWTDRVDNPDMTAPLGQQRQESRRQDCLGRIPGTGQLG
jgi:hypothetical protein